MHELSIALSLIDAACEEAERLGPCRVEALHLRIGPLAGVVTDALRFSFELASAGSSIDGARLVIEDVPLVARCPRCNEDRVLATPQHLRCPACGTATPEVVRGRELELFALEVSSDTAANR